MAKYFHGDFEKRQSFGTVAREIFGHTRSQQRADNDLFVMSSDKRYPPAPLEHAKCQQAGARFNVVACDERRFGRQAAVRASTCY